MRMIVLIAAMCTACEVADGVGTEVQEVAGPGGVSVVPLGGGQAVVSWSADPAAVSYRVLGSATGTNGPFSPAGSIASQTGQAPAPTSMTVAGLGSGQYCFEVRSVYLDGSVSDPGAAGCGTATGSGATPATRTVRLAASRGIPQNSTDLYSSDAGGVLGLPLVQWTVPLDVPDGATLVSVRGRVEDSPGTTLAFITTKSVDGNEVGIGGPGALSAHDGTWQTLSRSMSEVGAPGTLYYATVFTLAGAGAGHLAWVEADIAPGQ